MNDVVSLRARIAELEAERQRSRDAAHLSEERFRAFVRASSDVVYRMSADWGEMRLLEGRDFIANTTDPSRSWLEKYIHPDDQSLVMQTIREAVRTRNVFELEHRVIRVDGTLGWTFSRAIPLLDERGDVAEWLGAASDVTERRRAANKLAGQKRILEMVATGTPLNETLATLIGFIEGQEPGSRCSLLVVTEDGASLRCACGPSFPESYHAALDGVSVGPPYIGTCGEAVTLCTPVSVPDVAADTRFSQDWRDLLLAHDLRAVRSTPVCDGHGRPIGSFAIYYDRPRDPAPSDPELIKIATDLAAIILEHHSVEQALRMSEERYRLLVESAKDYAMVTLDMQGVITGWNSGAERMMGYSEAEALGQDAGIFFMPEDRAAGIPQDEMRRAAEDGRAENERWHLRKDGTRFWGSGLVTPLANGHQRGYVKIFQDKTATHAAMQRLHATVEASPFPIMLHAEDGEVLALSRSWTDYSGYAAEEIPTHHAWLRLAYPDRYEASLEALEQEFAAEEVVRSGEFTIRTKTGEVRIWDFQAVPLGRLPDGRRLQMRAAVDVTERKRASEALQESEERFRQLADNLPQLAWMAGPDGHIFWYNKRWYDYTGTTLETMQGWGWREVHHPDHIERVTQEVARHWATGEPWEGTYLLRSVAGEWRWFLTRAEPIRDAQGQLVHWFGTNTDITAQREAEAVLARDREELERLVEERTAALLRASEERRKAEEALRQSEKLAALGQLTGGVAHDFNNILQVVASGATLLRHSQLSEDRKEVILEGLGKAAENAKQLTNHLLSFARRQTLHPEAFDLNVRLAGMTELLRQTLGSRIKVETDFTADLWPVLADPNQLEVSVLNLAVNARDAMPEGGTIWLETRNAYLEATPERAAGEYVCFSVKDRGAGIPPAVLARVFEPFFTTKELGKGTGLGLPQVFGFAKQSGGDVSIESTPSQGTTVMLHLPRAIQEAGQVVPIRTRDAAEGAAMQHAAGKTVLVVEDNPDVASFASTMLEGLGYATRSAPNAAEALNLILSGEPVDAVFSDVVMPGEMNGVQLASVLRMQHPRIAVVLATGYSQVLAEWQGKAVAEVLGKPYRLDDLAAALERALAAVAVGGGPLPLGKAAEGSA